MSSGSSLELSSLTIIAVRRIDAVCDRFEEALQADRQPRIEESLGEVEDSVRSALLRQHVATGDRLIPPLKHPYGIWNAAFSHNGKTVLAACLDHTVRLWDAATGSPRGLALHCPEGIWAAAFSPDGKTILVARGDNAAMVWDTAARQFQGPPMRHQDRVDAIAFSPDGQMVLTGSADKTARMWYLFKPIDGEPDRISLWSQVVTGMELDEHGTVRVLDSTTWHERKQKLHDLWWPNQLSTLD